MKTALNSLGFEVESLSDALTKKRSVICLKNVIISPTKNFIKRILAFLGWEKYKLKVKGIGRDKAYNQNFEAFKKNHIGKIIYTTRKAALNHKIQDVLQNYDYVVVGSDMVWHNFDPELCKMIWNTDNITEMLEYYYLMFVPEEKRVNYAPSFGHKKAPEKFRELYKKGINGFKKLSCRENYGCNLIQDVTGREAVHVIDPTLLISPDVYRSIAKKPAFEIPEHYALVYGFFDFAKDLDNLMSSNDQFKGLSLIKIGDPNLPAISPEEWLWLFEHTDAVFTNSFHGTVFSIIFHKKFFEYERPEDGMKNKLYDILQTLGLEDRMYNNDARIPENDIDYKAVDEKLNNLREISINYLRDCLNV